MNILIAEPLAAPALKLLNSQPGWNVVVSSPKDFARHLATAEALIVRSAVAVDASVLSAAPKLRVIGRAGVGVDNIDLLAATAAGILVLNTPRHTSLSAPNPPQPLTLSLSRSVLTARAS